MKNKRMKKIIAGMLTVCMTLGCSSFPVWAEEENEETTETTVKNDGIENVLTADPIFTADPVQIEEEPEVVLGEGTVTEETPSFEYAYTAPRDGRYYVKVTNVSSNCYTDGGIYDNLGNSVVRLWGKGDKEEPIELEAGNDYTVQIRQYDKDNTNFKVTIMAQKETTDISEISEVKDQITFYKQKNIYTFTPKTDGNYRFELTDRTANARFNLMVRDSYDSKIMEEEIYGDKTGKTVELEANTEYQIQVSQNKGVGQYTLNIYQQKEKIDVSGYTEIDDTIQFIDQNIYYNFKAPVTGIYLIQADNMRKQFGVLCSVCDENGKEIAANGFWSSYDSNKKYDEGVELEEGKEYLLQISENSGVGEYSLLITYPEEAYDYLKDFQSSGNNKDESENNEEKAATSTEDNDTEASETEQLKQENAELKAELESIKEMLKENGIVSDDEEDTNN